MNSCKKDVAFFTIQCCLTWILPFGPISPIVAAKYGLSLNAMIVGGTTDSNSAFFSAAGGVSAGGNKSW